MLVYLDTNVVIYLIEQPVDFGPRAAARFNQLRAAGDALAVSDLTRIECRCGPMANGDTTTLAHFDTFFNLSDVGVLQLTTAVCDRATQIRAHHGFRTPDALHLAGAVEAGCDLFLTNDNRLGGFSDIVVEILPR